MELMVMIWVASKTFSKVPTKLGGGSFNQIHVCNPNAILKIDWAQLLVPK